MVIYRHKMYMYMYWNAFFPILSMFISLLNFRDISKELSS